MKNVIYKIENIKNGKFYVGSAVDFLARKRTHLFQLRHNEHHSIYLQRSYNKYGEEGFLFSILEHDIEESQLIIREQYYLDLLKPTYNSCPTAHSMKGFKHSPESIEKSRAANNYKVSKEYKAILSERMKGNKIQVGNTNNRKVTTEILNQVRVLRASGLGCRRIAKITGLNKTTILNIFNNKYNYG